MKRRISLDHTSAKKLKLDESDSELGIVLN